MCLIRLDFVGVVVVVVVGPRFFVHAEFIVSGKGGSIEVEGGNDGTSYREEEKSSVGDSQSRQGQRRHWKLHHFE